MLCAKRGFVGWVGWTPFHSGRGEAARSLIETLGRAVASLCCAAAAAAAALSATKALKILEVEKRLL